jgi:hypothetical protein
MVFISRFIENYVERKRNLLVKGCDWYFAKGREARGEARMKNARGME